MVPSSGPRITLLLLPGLDGDGRLFDRFRAPIEAEGLYRILVVSYNALGLSTYREIQAVVRDRMVGLGPVVLVGESFSGPVVVQVCASPPPNLIAGVVVASFPYSPVGLPRPLVRGFGKLLGVLPTPSWAIRFGLVGNSADDELIEDVKQAVSSMSSQLRKKRLDAILDVDIRADLGQCLVPLLSIRASADRLVPSRVSRQMGKSCEQLVEVELEGPHLLVQTRPLDVIREIRSFVRRVTVGAASNQPLEGA